MGFLAKGSSLLRSYYSFLSAKRVVSFDIFDTLVERECLVPFDVFFLAAQRFYSDKDKAIGFAKARMLAEVRSKVGMPDGETTLDRIYKFIDWDKAVIHSLMQLELSTEMEVCRPKKSGVEALKKAMASEATIVLTTDMYLSKSFIEQILSKCGIEGYERIFLSNEYGRNKVSGGLFEVLKQTMKVTSDEIVHVGDNMKADYLGAQKAGIDSVLVCRKSFLKRLLFSKMGVELSLRIRY